MHRNKAADISRQCDPPKKMRRSSETEREGKEGGKGARDNSTPTWHDCLMLHLHPCPDSIHPASRRGLQPLSSTQLRAALHSPSNVHCHGLVAAGQPVLVLQHGRKHGGSNAHRNGSLNALNRIEEKKM